MSFSYPVPFVVLPRINGTDQADLVPTEAAYAAALDANFTRVNTWADAAVDQIKIKRIDPSFTFVGAGVTPGFTGTSATCGLYVIGEVRFISLAMTYATGPVYSGGSIGSLKVGTMTDARFFPSTALYFCGHAAKGMCTFSLQTNGDVFLEELSYTNQKMTAGESLVFTGMWINRV